MQPYSLYCGPEFLFPFCFLRFDSFDDCVVILHVENIELDQGPFRVPPSENVTPQQDIYPSLPARDVHFGVVECRYIPVEAFL